MASASRRHPVIPTTLPGSGRPACLGDAHGPFVPSNRADRRLKRLPRIPAAKTATDAPRLPVRQTLLPGDGQADVAAGIVLRIGTSSSASRKKEAASSGMTGLI